MSKKQYIVLMILFLVSIFIMGLSSTFAYFTNLNIATESGKSQVSSVQMETLTFHAGNPLTFYATEFNFGEDMDNLITSTDSTINLKAASDGRVATYYYDMTLQIEENTFEYSLTLDRPELLLVIKQPDGQPLTHLGELRYVTAGGQQGFDITKLAPGTYPIVSKYKIETTGEVSHNWNTSIIFVNYEDSQDGNRGKLLRGQIIIKENDEDRA